MTYLVYVCVCVRVRPLRASDIFAFLTRDRKSTSDGNARCGLQVQTRLGLSACEFESDRESRGDRSFLGLLAPFSLALRVR
jgi:hypothetical protein